MSVSDRPHSTACFSVLAHVDPGVMPRVMQLFAKRGLVPSRWHSSVAGPRQDELHIDLEVTAPMDLAERIAAAMRQLTEVRLVLMSEKLVALSA